MILNICIYNRGESLENIYEPLEEGVFPSDNSQNGGTTGQGTRAQVGRLLQAVCQTLLSDSCQTVTLLT